MKSKKKALALALCAVLLVVTSVLGTMAYLTDSEQVKNTFTVGQVHIDLDEAPVGEDGKKIEGARVKENDYRLLPGFTYDKDPMVTVEAKSENCYVRMMATVTLSEAADKMLGATGVTNWINVDYDNWTLVNGEAPTTVTNEDGTLSRTYEFRYKEIVKKSDNATQLTPLFTTITVPGEITNEQIATLEGFKIDIEAHAIQADGFATADLAWAEWK